MRINFLSTYKTLILIPCLLFAFSRACAKSVPDTAEINKLNRLASAKFASSPDSALVYGLQGIALSEKQNYKPGQAEGLLQTAKVYYLKGRSAEAVTAFDKAIKLFSDLNNQKKLAECYIHYGRMYNLLAKYKDALSCFEKALAIDKYTGDEKALADCYKNIGVVHFSEGQLSKALDYYYNGLFIAVKNNYQLLTAELYNNIGVILQSMEVYPNALDYYHKSLKIFEGTGNLHAVGTIDENIGEVLLAQSNYDSAIDYLNRANNVAKKQNDKDGLSSVYTDLGLCFANKHQYQKAVRYLDTSLRIAVKYKIVYNQAYAMIGFATVYNMQKQYQTAYDYAIQGQHLGVVLGNLSIRATAAMQLNKTYAGLGRVADAYKSLNDYIDLKNGLKNDESIQKLTSYNYELSFSVKQRLAVQQQREKELIYEQNLRNGRMRQWLFGVIIIAAVIIALIYYFDRRKQRKINSLLKNNNAVVLEQRNNLDQQTHKLNDLNTLKDRLIAILAHDLRAPLSTLRGLFDLLQDDTISHEQLLEMIPPVIKKLDYTSDFLDTLLFWINSQMENFDKAVKPFPLAEMMEKEIQNLNDQASAKKISLFANIEEGIVAYADPDSVRIVIRNLVSNAIKFCVEDDIIELSAKANGDNIVVRVKDTGIGMTVEQSEKIFKGKMQSKIGTHNESGTGMGLLFCKDLIEKCNGTIWVKSKHGVGSEFSFTIPKN